jgi:SAM-dependent methyltransferase
MRWFDRLLQTWRASKATPWIPRGARVLDVGCHQGEFLRRLGERIGPSVGLDPLAHSESNERFRILAEPLSEPSGFDSASFDVVVMLATLEHIQDKEPLARECRRLLRLGGRVIVTVPAPLVDRVVDLMRRLRMADGMSLEEHHGFDPTTTPEIFAQHGFELEHVSRFQLGLNYLFVFRKSDDAPLRATSRSEQAECVGAGADV